MKNQTTIGEFIELLKRRGTDTILVISNDLDYDHSHATTPVPSLMYMDENDQLHQVYKKGSKEVVCLDFFRPFPKK